MIEKIYEKPEIYRIMVPLPENPLKLLNSYVIKDGDESLIIDTGFNRFECWNELTSGLSALNVDLTKTKVMLTHLHSDHTGLVGQLIEGGATAYISAVDNYMLSLKERWATMEATFVKYGYPQEDVALQRNNQAIVYAPVYGFPAVELNDRDTISVGDVQLECIHVPGHTPGQMVLYIRDKKILFSADHVLFDITPNISVWGDDDHSLEDYLKSLDLVANLDIETTFPGHREFAGDIYERINTIKAHHMKRLQEILDAAVLDQVNTIYDIAAHVSWSARGRKFVDFAPTQKWFAMGETLSHVFWLIHNGYISLDDENHIKVVKGKMDWTNHIR